MQVGTPGHRRRTRRSRTRELVHIAASSSVEELPSNTIDRVSGLRSRHCYHLPASTKSDAVKIYTSPEPQNDRIDGIAVATYIEANLPFRLSSHYAFVAVRNGLKIEVQHRPPARRGVCGQFSNRPRSPDRTRTQHTLPQERCLCILVSASVLVQRLYPLIMILVCMVLWQWNSLSCLESCT